MRKCEGEDILKTYTVHTFLFEPKLRRNAYLIKGNNFAVLIDPGMRKHQTKLLKQITEIIAIDQIDVVILQNTQTDNVGALPYLEHHGLKAMVLVNDRIMRDLDINLAVQSIANIYYELVFSDDFKLQFIVTPFLPYPESFVTYIEGGNELFTNGLFNQLHSTESRSVATIKNAIQQHHELFMPSSEFVRFGLKKLKAYKVQGVYPSMGSFITKDTISSILRWLPTVDFYNTDQVVLTKGEKNKQYNYVALCNHMLKRLETVFERSEITRIFVDSPIVLERTPSLEIQSTSLQKVALWNAFFERIYQKKGVKWLHILEPLIKKYQKNYNIRKPSIYRSTMMQQSSKIETLDASKQALEEKITALNAKMVETRDHLLKCPITRLYNEMFLRQHLLSNDFKTPPPVNTTRAMVLIQVDQLAQFNQKYGKDVGDETLRNLVYTVDRIKHEDTLVFKQNGPGLIVYKHKTNVKKLKDFALRLRSTIEEATVFIEPVTVSMALVTLEDIDTKTSTIEQVNTFFEIASKRLERGKRKGSGQITDASSEDSAYVDGNILLVDEDETNQNLMKRLFERIHYNVIIVEDIFEAYTVVESTQIDVIISEINLSKLDGFQFKHKLNSVPKYRDIPFIIASHHKNKDVIMRCNDLDIDVILQKPFIPEELIGYVKRFKESWRR